MSSSSWSFLTGAATRPGSRELLRSASRRRPCARAGRRTRRRRCPGRCPRASSPSSSGTSTCGPDERRRARATGRSGRRRRRASTTSRRRRCASSAISKSSSEVRVDLLVDDHAGRRVRDVDERRAALGVGADRLAHLAVMSRSWVLRSVVTWISRTGGYPTRPMATALREQPRRLPGRGGSLHRRARRGVLPPLRGPQGELRARADLRALRRSDDARRAPASSPARPSAGGAGETELWRFACEGYLGNLTRGGGRGDRRARGVAQATVDGEEIPYRHAAPDDRERARPRPARAARSGPDRAGRGAPEAALDARTTEKRREGTRALGAPDLPRALRALRLPARGARRAGAGVSRRDRGAARGRIRPTPARAASASRSRRRAATTCSASSARSEWDAGFPGDRMVPALEWTLDGLGIDLSAQENVHLDLEPRPQKSPARVLRADRGARAA